MYRLLNYMQLPVLTMFKLNVLGKAHRHFEASHMQILP